MLYNSVIVATGSYLPEKILTNVDLQQQLATNDEWITSRTGIKQRHIIADNQLNSDMASFAALDALQSGQIKPIDLDLIIVCTTTPDYTFPSVAVAVQEKLGLKNIPCFDLQAVCSGFIYGLSVANAYITAGIYKKILVIGSDAMSKIVDWQDRNTAVLFGDGAGAVIIEARKDQEGIICCNINANGGLQSILETTGGVTLNQKTGYVTINGKEVFKNAVDLMSQSIMNSLKQTSYQLADIAFIIPHQANIRIIKAIAQNLNLDISKFANTIANHGNTSAATIPLAMDYYYKNNLLTKNSLIALTAVGGGLTWGSAILRWFI